METKKICSIVTRETMMKGRTERIERKLKIRKTPMIVRIY